MHSNMLVSFLLGAVAFEQIGHLAAQKQALQGVAGFEEGRQVLDLFARAGARKVQQVGVLEEIQGCFADDDAQFAIRAVTSLRGRVTRAPVAPGQGQRPATTVPSPLRVCTSMMLCSRGNSAPARRWRRRRN